MSRSDELEYNMICDHCGVPIRNSLSETNVGHVFFDAHHQLHCEDTQKHLPRLSKYSREEILAKFVR